MQGEAFSRISIIQNRAGTTAGAVLLSLIVSSAVPMYASNPISHPVSQDASPRESKDVGTQVAALPQIGAIRAGRNARSASGQVPLAQNRQVAEIQANLFTGAVVAPADTEEGAALNDDHTPEQKSNLFEGTTLFVPQHDMDVSTIHGVVHIGGKSVALISATADGLAVYDVHDSKKGNIRVTANGETHTLSPGRHMLISTDKSGEFASANALELIPHSNVKQVQTGRTKTVYKSEFSIPAAISSVTALKDLMKSEDPELRKTAGKIAKTASILLYMRTANYQQYFRPRVTTLSAR
ncbi:hypothetical protein KF728_06440 [Candidatus Obscuribacterales bacterium]|nr:hypothetical protein [Candidatus Obscuribacterales bacterium]